MGAQEVLVLGSVWILGSFFVAGVAGRLRGLGGFFLYLLAALFFSPLLAVIALVAVIQGGILERLDELVTLRPGDRAAGGRFGGLAGE